MLTVQQNAKIPKIVVFCFTVFVIYDILLSIYQLLVSAAALLFGFLTNNIVNEQIKIKTQFSQFDKRGIFLLIKTHCSGLC